MACKRVKKEAAEHFVGESYIVLDVLKKKKSERKDISLE